MQVFSSVFVSVWLFRCVVYEYLNSLIWAWVSAPPKSSDESVTKEGALQKKKDNDDGGVASKDRSWKGVYMVQKGTSLTTFKDQKSSKVTIIK